MSALRIFRQLVPISLGDHACSMASNTGEESLSDGSLIFKSWPSPVHSNSPRRNLTPSEIEAVQSFVSGAEAEVTRCTDEVARLQAMTAKVKEYQTELAHKISVHQSFICLINRLPSELLSLIFSFFCTVDFWDWGPFEAKMKSPMRGSFFREPFVIATVCRRWRNIALSTPSLWSTIMLAGDDLEDKDRGEEKIHYSREDYRPEEDDSEEPCIFPDEVLEVALERSAQHSLTLWTMHLDMDQFYWPSAFTRMLRQVSPRFKEMHLAGGSDPFRHKDSPNVVFDQLSVVQVFPYHNGNWIGMDPLPWLSTAPNVRTLILESSDSEEDFWTHVPVQSIQYLFFEQDDITTGISKLARFPNIVSSGMMCGVEGKYAWEAPLSFHHLRLNVECS
ncbi:hypothetical protein C8J56DRAFT_1074042 [Mycena floridula]|nr:hypothetical protein C8J56DRAFT_1074042 [Mycena floridula]